MTPSRLTTAFLLVPPPTLVPEIFLCNSVLAVTATVHAVSLLSFPLLLCYDLISLCNSRTFQFQFPNVTARNAVGVLLLESAAVTDCSLDHDQCCPLRLTLASKVSSHSLSFFCGLLSPPFCLATVSRNVRKHAEEEIVDELPAVILRRMASFLLAYLLPAYCSPAASHVVCTEKP